METSAIINSQTNSVKTNLLANVSPKLAFVFGLLTGVAAFSLIGFVLAASYVFSGKSPAQLAVTASNPPSLAETSAPAAAGTVNIPLRPDDYIRGDKNAPVTLVEYSDLECPFCKRFHPDMQRLMQEYAGKVKWVYRHFPLSFHANAQKEGEAAECAGKLGGNDKFWQYVDKIFERTASNGTGFALADLVPLAKELGLPEAEFKTCLDSGEFAAKVQNDLSQGASYGVQGTPTTFVNGIAVEGAVPYEQLKAVVESLLQ